ncbi:MAG TPA: HAD family hydrolase [Bryobacteraceae bacterium]|jgi:phosphoglycolate phosphatase-like HAD superfamily hydrolase|nr:HAD family hydrolase [Bryobacteraceae bacterium]
MPSEYLVLFDIDGTLLRRAGPHHRAALVAAIREVSGYATTLDDVPTSGMLDRDLIRIMLENAGAPPGTYTTYLAAISALAEERYCETCPDLRDKVCPGVGQALSSLQQARIPAGLVTGNLARIGWTKMERAGLRHHFVVGAFSDMGETRAQLVSFALHAAQRQSLISSDAKAALVGDHPNDMIAARVNGLRAIGVETGLSTAAQLYESGAHIVLQDLSAFDPDTLWI